MSYGNLLNDTSQRRALEALLAGENELPVGWAGPGSVARSVAEKLSTFVNVRDYGAEPGGSDASYGILKAIENAPPGSRVVMDNQMFAVSEPIKVERGDIIIDFSGWITPYGSYSGYLFELTGSLMERTLNGNSTWGPSPRVAQVNLDGMGQARGGYVHHVDHFHLSALRAQRTLGTAWRLEYLREADIYGLTATLCNAAGASEPVVHFYDTDISGAPPWSPGEAAYADASNNVAIHGLNIVHCNGTYLEFGSDGSNGTRQRQLCFYRAQLHHYDTQPRDYGLVVLDDDTPCMIHNRTGYSIQFFGANIRIPGNNGSIASGTLIRDTTDTLFDSSQYIPNNMQFFGGRISTENASVTGIDASQACGSIELHHTDFEVRNGTPAAPDPGNRIYFRTRESISLKEINNNEEPPLRRLGSLALTTGNGAITNGLGAYGRGLYRYNGTSWVPAITQEALATASAADLADAAASINTSNKFLSKRVRDVTNDRIFWARGASATSAWRPFDTQDGSADIVPA